MFLVWGCFDTFPGGWNLPTLIRWVTIRDYITNSARLKASQLELSLAKKNCWIYLPLIQPEMLTPNACVHTWQYNCTLNKSNRANIVNLFPSSSIFANPFKYLNVPKQLSKLSLSCFYYIVLIHHGGTHHVWNYNCNISEISADCAADYARVEKSTLTIVSRNYMAQSVVQFYGWKG